MRRWAQTPGSGTVIGMHEIKQRRLQLRLNSYVDLRVGDCVSFLLLPAFHHALRDPIKRIIPNWPIVGGRSPSFTWKRTCGSPLCGQRPAGCVGRSHFPMQGRLTSKIDVSWQTWERSDWSAVQARNWRDCKEPKQAEFLIEQRFPWELITRIGVRTKRIWRRVVELLDSHEPPVRVMPNWYY